MRNLTILRRKKFTGCLVSLKVYIENQASTELVINDTPCSFLGEIKNGEEKIFQIDDVARKVYVIADVTSRNYCNDMYQLPEGSEDIYLSGGCQSNFVSGNAFLFDGNENNEEAMANRKRSKKKGIIFVCVAVFVGILIGILPALLSIGSNKPETFTVDGMSITLTKAFDKVEIEGFDAVYSTEKVSAFISKESFSLMSGLGSYTLREYGELVMDVNNFSGELKTKDDLMYFEYTSEDVDNYNYIAFIYKADDAFWMVQFATDEDDYDSYTDRIYEWAASVKFN